MGDLLNWNKSPNSIRIDQFIVKYHIFIQILICLLWMVLPSGGIRLSGRRHVSTRTLADCCSVFTSSNALSFQITISPYFFLTWYRFRYIHYIRVIQESWSFSENRSGNECFFFRENVFLGPLARSGLTTGQQQPTKEFIWSTSLR